MTTSEFGLLRPAASLMKRLAPWLVVLSIALPAGAADPNVDPQIDWARTADPMIELAPTRVLWPAGLDAMWLKALRHPESDLRREAADSITRAHQLGMPGLEELTEGLIDVLENPEEHPVARTAAARALVEIDARRAAPLLAEHARRGPIELSLSVEPTLARWDFEPARAIWLERLTDPSTAPVYLQLAIECLGQVTEARAAPELKRLALAPSASASSRLAAARALAKFPISGLTEIARQLANDSSPRSLVVRLVGANLLAHQSDEDALEVLDQYALAAEPTVAAQAMQRLLEIAPERLVRRAASMVGNEDARIRHLTVQALATAPSEVSVVTLVPVLNDGVPEIRYDARRILLAMAGRDELRPVVIEHATRVVDGDQWRGLEQAILILTELDQKQVGQRLLQLLHHARPEVYVSSAWGLRKLAVPELIEPMFEEAKRISTEVASGEAADKASTALAQLLEAIGQMDHQPAEPYLRMFIPKSSPYSAEVRTAAIWSLGYLWADSDSLDQALVDQLEQRLADVLSIPPESNDIRAMSAVTLGRMKSEASLPALRRWYAADGPSSYVGRCCGWAIEQMTGESIPDANPATRHLRGWFLEPIHE